MSRYPTIVAAAHALRSGDATPQTLVAEALENIDRLDAQIRAWVVIDRHGAGKAAELAARELAAGVNRGPLHGIPIGIKDIVDVADLPTRAGSTLTSAAPVARDATIVAKLRDAGAIILGKTVTTEFACFDPSPTRNPWNVTHTPGGSSSGSAAAVASGMCFAAIASQTGGSITRPASYCGVAGCKPTFGRVSRSGVVPVSFHLDHVGAMARSAADLGILLTAIAGDDPSDPGSIPHERLDVAVSEDAVGRERPVAPSRPRLGVLREFFFDEADAEVATLTERALAGLAEQRAQVADLPLPAGFDRVHAMHRRLMAAEAADYHRRTFAAPRDGYGPNMAGLLSEGLSISMSEFQQALEHQRSFASSVARSLVGVDALVTPATPSAAPASLATTGDPRFNSPWSHAGVPTVSIPFALNTHGMPISLQLIGAAWSEARLLAVASWCESRLQFSASPSCVAS